MTDTPIITLALYAQTDVGMVRSGNEDNFLILDLSTGKSWTASEEENGDLLTFNQGYYGSLLAVSDGMGGALAGEVASRMAVETVRDRMLQLQAHAVYGKLPFHERLRLAIEEANLLINRESGSNPEHKGLGATFTAVAVQGSHVYFAQVGDSRAHLIRKGRIARITKDQSLVQQLIDAGQISEEEAETHSYRNVILQALGAHNSVNVEVSTLSLRQLDTLLLCSDGLSGKMREDEIASIVAEAPDLKSACRELISLANERGGEDNITVVIAQFSGAGLPPSDREPIEPELIARPIDTPTTINLSEGGETQPLDAAGEPSPTPPNDAPPRVTSPITPPPSPPSQSSPPVSKPPRNNPNDSARSSDLSGRRGPITSVFAPDDVEEDEQVTASLRQPQAGVTAATAQRRTKALTSDASETSAMPTLPSASPQGGSSPDGRAARPSTDKPSGGPKLALLILGGLMILALSIGAFWYYRAAQQKEIERQQLAEREKQQQALQARISNLRERIIQLTKRTSQSSESLAARETLRRRLDELGQRLDAAQKDSLSPEKFASVNQACDEIEQTFSSLQSELDKLSGFPPRRFINLRPVAC
jgi:protein phosphatase